MSIQEKDIYAALGMDVPAEQPEAAEPAAQKGANEPELTEPAGQEDKNSTDDKSSSGEKTEAGNAPDGVAQDMRRNRDTAGKSGEKAPAGADGNAAEDGGKDPGGKKMSREERARQAQMRRQREQSAAVQAAVEAERKRLEAQHAKELEEVFSKAGMTDRYDGNKPIKSMEEFRAWNSKAQAAGLSRRLQEGKLTPEDFQAAVDSSPAVQAARAAVERMEAREQEQDREQHRQQVERELAEIHALDPGINGLEDILARETGEEFTRLVTENHLTFVQAFKLANGDQLDRARAMTAAEVSARNQSGKSHMRTASSGGDLAPDVPRRVIAAYTALDPNMTLEEIRKDYQKQKLYVK